MVHSLILIINIINIIIINITTIIYLNFMFHLVFTIVILFFVPNLSPIRYHLFIILVTVYFNSLY